MRFYFTKNSELVPFDGLPFIYEQFSGLDENPNRVLLDNTRAATYAAAITHIEHPNLIYLHPNCDGFFDRLGKNPYQVSVGVARFADDMIARLKKTVIIFRRIDYHFDNIWLDYYKIRPEHASGLFRNAIITQLLEDIA